MSEQIKEDSSQSSSIISSHSKNEEENMKMRIQQLKIMAIGLKKQLMEEKKEEFDRTIIEHVQNQKKKFQEMSEEIKATERSRIEQIHSDREISKEKLKEKNQKMQNEEVLKNNIKMYKIKVEELETSLQEQDIEKEKLKAENVMLGGQIKRLQERLDKLVAQKDQLTSQNQLVAEEQKNMKRNLEKLYEKRLFVQWQMVQIVQSDQIQIDASAEECLLCIKEQAIQLFKREIEQNLYLSASQTQQYFEWKEPPFLEFNIQELCSIDYQKITIKLNFISGISLKVQFKTSDSLRFFDSILYLSRLRTSITQRRPFFNHPDLPKINGVIGRVVKSLNESTASQIANISSSHFNDYSSSSIEARQSAPHQQQQSALFSSQIQGQQSSATKKRQDNIFSSQKLNPVTCSANHSDAKLLLFHNKTLVQSSSNSKNKSPRTQENSNTNLLKFLQQANSSNKEFTSAQNQRPLSSEQNYNLKQNMQGSVSNFRVTESLENKHDNLSGQHKPIQLKDLSLPPNVGQEQIESGRQQINLQKIMINNNSDIQQRETAILFLKRGTLMMKYSKDGIKPREKLIFLSGDEQHLNWQPPNKQEKTPKYICLKEIVQIALGRNSPGFEKFKKIQKPFAGNRSFFIICTNGRRLELEAADGTTRNFFIKNLELLLQTEFRNSYTQKSLNLDISTINPASDSD